MFCANCGKEIDDNAVVCVHCGNSTAPYAGPDNSVQNTNQQTEQSPQFKKANKLNIAGLAVGAGSVIASPFLFLFGLIFSMLSGTNLISIVFCLILPVAGIVISSIAVHSMKKFKRVSALSIIGVVVSVFSLLLWISFCISYTIRFGFIVY